MKYLEIKNLKHEFSQGIFERGHENDPKSPNMLNYSLTCSKKGRWKEGMVINNFVKVHHDVIMYHSTVRVDKLIKENGKWICTKEELDNFLNKVSLDSEGQPLDKGPYVFNGEYIDSNDWKYGDIVKWPKDKIGRQLRNWATKKTPTRLTTDRFENYNQPTDISFIPFSELVKILNNKRMIDLLSVRGLYQITDGVNPSEIVNRYVGSASSEIGGLFSRFGDYIRTGHGGNKKLIEEYTINSEFLNNCFFTVLSVFPSDYDLNDILRAEANKKREFICLWN
jgi:hypothetical protein